MYPRAYSQYLDSLAPKIQIIFSLLYIYLFSRVPKRGR